MDKAALIIGYTVEWAFFVWIASLIGGAIYWLFPARFYWNRRPGAQWKLPDRLLSVDRLMGFGKRHGDGWFIGFISFSPGYEPQVLAKKSDIQ